MNTSIEERLNRLDKIQARRFSKLEPEARRIAIVGINRHFRACDKHKIFVDLGAIREIIDDAIKGWQMWRESETGAAGKRRVM